MFISTHNSPYTQAAVFYRTTMFSILIHGTSTNKPSLGLRKYRGDIGIGIYEDRERGSWWYGWRCWGQWWRGCWDGWGLMIPVTRGSYYMERALSVDVGGEGVIKWCGVDVRRWRVKHKHCQWLVFCSCHTPGYSVLELPAFWGLGSGEQGTRIGLFGFDKQ